MIKYIYLIILVLKIGWKLFLNLNVYIDFDDICIKILFKKLLIYVFKNCDLVFLIFFIYCIYVKWSGFK